ncbi:UNVERIFIED_CONTAM: flagellar protein FlaG [Acetivibrio alkalicellulosi]
MRIDGTDASALQFKNAANSTTSVDTVKNSENVENRVYPGQKSDHLKADRPVSENAVIDAIEKANKVMTGAQMQLEFSIHEKTKEIMVKVINTSTNEVVREIPSEKILDMVAKMYEIVGIIVDERR